MMRFEIQFVIRLLIAVSALGLTACSMEVVDDHPVDKEDIRKVILSHNKEIRQCYEAALEQEPMIEGKVVMQWKLGKDGTPQDLKVQEASPKLQAVTPCMIEKMKTWVFPHDHPEADVSVAYPFIFSENNQFKRVLRESKKTPAAAASPAPAAAAPSAALTRKSAPLPKETPTIEVSPAVKPPDSGFQFPAEAPSAP